MAQLSDESSGCSNALRQDDRDVALHSKYKIFLSHSGSQKDFVEQLCVDLERCDRYTFFDKRRDSLPIGENFAHHIFGAIRQCHVGVVVLSEEFFTHSKWPMIELAAMVEEAKVRRLSFKIVPVFLSIPLDQFHDETKRNEWLSCWTELALKDKRVEVEQWREALKYLHPINSLVYDGLGEVKFRKVIVEGLCKVVRAETSGAGRHVLEWLGIVHRISADGVMRRLERLKRKSLLERFGDGSKVQTGMHDLWHAFCKAEVETGELRGRRWMYGANGSEIVDTSSSGGCWENVKRMALVGSGSIQKLERVKFAQFSNVTVLKMTGLDMTEEVVLDLSGLIHLKSLEVEGQGLHDLFVLQGSPSCLMFLRWKSYDRTSSWPCSLVQFVQEVGFLTELQYLVLSDYLGGELPHLSRLTSLRVAIFFDCVNVKTLSGLSSKLSNLRVVNLSDCTQLRSCPGVGDLVALEELNCGSYKMLELPNLGRLRNLRILDVSGCPLITEVPGLGNLGALQELRVGSYTEESCIFHLPDMCKLSRLQVLDLRWRRLEAVAGLESLVSLQELSADFREVAERPSLRQLTKLRSLDIHGWSLEGLKELGNLAKLRTVHIRACSGVNKLPDIGSLINLQLLRIEECEFSDVSGVSGLSALETFWIQDCEELERLPDLERLPKLTSLSIWGCPTLRGWNCTIQGQVEGSPCRLDGTKDGSEVSSSRSLRDLRDLTLRICRNVEDVTGFEAFSQLEHLHCGNLTVNELPDLTNFPRLKSLRLYNWTSLRRLTSRDPMHTLSILFVRWCSSLATLPDLSYVSGLQEIGLVRCERLSTLSSVGPLTALRSLELDGCISLNALPDLGMFPVLEELWLKGCSGLMTLSSSVRLPALKKLDARGCESLRDDDLEQLRALCPQCRIKCGALPVAQVESDVVRSGALESDLGNKWRRRAVGAGGVMLALCWILHNRRRSRARDR